MRHRNLCQCATCRTTNLHNHPEGAAGYWKTNQEDKTMKTSFDHTAMKGWKIDPDDSTRVIFDSYWDSTLHCGGSVGVGCQTPEQARLIAQAPELLEALVAATDYLAEFFEEGREHRVIRTADAVVRRVEGTRR